MFENVESEQLKKEIKFFFRFLKENGIYSAYKKYIFNPKTQNQYQKHHPNWSIRKCAISDGTKKLITMLITWDRTKEGYDYWYKWHCKFLREFSSKFEKYD